MRFIWKLLRRHISAAQLTGFFLANLTGMLIVLLGVQCYEDFLPAFAGDDGVIKSTYLVVSKHITAVSSLSGSAPAFDDTDIQDLEAQPFGSRVGRFTASRYQVYASIAVGGMGLGTDMFFESVPDAFVDIAWPEAPATHDESSLPEVPIVLPRSYLAIYNFGFAQSKSLPKVSEGVASMVRLGLRLRGQGGRELRLRGRVVGFSTRLNTILVPESFMQRTNAELAPGTTAEPTRLIVEVRNPADDRIATYMQQRGYELEDDSLAAGRATYFVKVLAAIVLAVGLVISVLAFYILMLSIFLLVQKNAEKLQNLLLIGYSPARVSLPYQLLAVGLNALVFLLALGGLVWLRGLYLDRLWQMFPQLPQGTLLPAIAVGGLLFLLVSVFNVVAIRHKIQSLF